MYKNYRFFLNSLLLAILLTILPSVCRQATRAQAALSPTLHIVDVNTTEFPQLQVAVRGANWSAPLADLPATLTLDDHPLPLQNDQTVQQGIQVAVAIDVNQLVARNAAGQSGFVELTGTLLDLVEADVFRRNEDWLAAYQLQGDGAPLSMQSWTQEPNLLFNSIVGNRPAAVSESPLSAQALTDLLMVMTELPDAATLPKVLLLFSTGATLADLTPILAVAHQEQIAIHVVELLNSAEAPQSDSLAQLAQQSGGHYMALTDPAQSAAVGTALTNAHSVRLLEARSVVATPQALTVAVTLPDETTLTTTLDAEQDPDLFAALRAEPMQITIDAPAATTISWNELATGPTLDANARLLPVQTSFTWPDNRPRELLQVSYTLRGPAGFAQQEIRTEAPFDQAMLPLTALRAGEYTLDIMALDELGVEADVAPVTLQFSDLPPIASAAIVADQAPSAESDDVPEQTDETLAAPDDGAVAAASAAPQAQSEDASPSSGDTIQIPGLQMQLPRALLVWSLPVLLLLIGYLIYSDRRDRRHQQRAQQRPLTAPPLAMASAGDPRFDLQDESRPPAGNRYALNPAGEDATRRYEIDNAPPAKVRTANPSLLTTPEAPTIRDAEDVDEDPSPAPPALRSIAPVDQEEQKPRWEREDESDDELTVTPTRPEDEEATFRTQDVARPVIGYLVRTTSDPNLPKELPIYSLASAHGELRQIYIGRHSKHNTVVINDKRVSREHAVIIQRDGRLYLRDNASTAGTFLNWKRLNPGEELLLRSNDLVSFGEIAYVFRLHDEEEATAHNR